VPIVHQCAAPDCKVLTMGLLCLDHERELGAPAGVRRVARRTLRLPRSAARPAASGVTAAFPPS